MAYDWNNYLQFAKMLLSNSAYPDDLTNYRIIASRAYYAAFHIASEFRERHNLPNGPLGAVHERLISAYKNMQRKDVAFQTKCHKISYELERLKKRRQDADYDSGWKCTENAARAAIYESDNVITIVKELERDYFKSN